MADARGTLTWTPVLDRPELVAAPVLAAAASVPAALSCAIDPTLADTAAFCRAYDVAEQHSANCVVVAARRGELTRYAAVMVLAADRADVNGVVRRAMDARRCSFAPMDLATSATGMEYGGITPIGLPAEWEILVDARAFGAGEVVVGSGLRTGKILLEGAALAGLPNARVLDLALPRGG